MYTETADFFMLVTNRDVYLASYTIKSYQKLAPVLQEYNWKLIVYLNCVKDDFKKVYIPEWKKYPFVEIVDNAEFINVDELIPGNFIKSDEGWLKLIEGRYEPCGVVWTRAFRNFTSDYWVTVDADFEILSADFVIEAFKILQEKKDVVAVSSDFSNTNYVFDTFSNEGIIAMKRYNTWFCIYKKEAQKCKTSHFYYQEIVHGLRLSFDEAAKFQSDLREQFGYDMRSVDEKYRRSFIHYGAFSKNNSLDTPKKIGAYRKIAILSHRGLLGTNLIIDKIVRKCFMLIYKVIYKKTSAERGKNNFHSRLDD